MHVIVPHQSVIPRKMAAKQEINTAQLFGEITKNFRDGDFVQAQKICNKSTQNFLNF